MIFCNRNSFYFFFLIATREGIDNRYTMIKSRFFVFPMDKCCRDIILIPFFENPQPPNIQIGSRWGSLYCFTGSRYLLISIQ